MNNVLGANQTEKLSLNAPFRDHIETLLNKPIFVDIPVCTLQDCFKEMASRSSWTRQTTAPSVVDTL